MLNPIVVTSLLLKSTLWGAENAGLELPDQTINDGTIEN